MTNEELKKLFIKEVHEAARARYAVDVFADMVRAMAICFEAPLALGERHEELEKEYAQIKGRYTEDEVTALEMAARRILARHFQRERNWARRRAKRAGGHEEVEE